MFYLTEASSKPEEDGVCASEHYCTPIDKPVLHCLVASSKPEEEDGVCVCVTLLHSY